MFLPHPRVKLSIVESLRDREVACSEFRILCLEDSVISFISPCSGGTPGPVWPICAQRGPKVRFISFDDSFRTSSFKCSSVALSLIYFEFDWLRRNWKCNVSVGATTALNTMHLIRVSDDKIVIKQDERGFRVNRPRRVWLTLLITLSDVIRSINM